jgi:DNA-directed RNA polymerase subunit RPC12/RpoP
MDESAAVAQTTEVKEHKFPCKQCGADLVFAPGQNELKCPYCGHLEQIPTTADAIKEYSFNDYLAQPRSHGYGDSTGRDARCDNCGAVTHLDPSIRATKCPFCGAPIVTGESEKSAVDDQGVITPEAVLPFKITADQAQAAFKKWVASLWFAPSAIKNESHLKQLSGVYRPFWTYDSHTVSHWTGERGDYYWVTETYTTVENGKTVTRTRQVRHTRWTYVSGVYSDFFDDVLISAGRNSDFVTNYHLKDLQPYSPEYLSGFAAERYVVSCEDGWKDAKNVIAGEIHSAVRRQIGGDEQRVSSINTAYSGITYKHILLPLWLSCYRYGGKTYCFQVNGQTGEVAGARPWSFWKIFFLVISILAIIAVIVVIVNRTH